MSILRMISALVAVYVNEIPNQVLRCSLFSKRCRAASEKDDGQILGSVLILTLLMREEIPVDCRKISQNFLQQVSRRAF